MMTNDEFVAWLKGLVVLMEGPPPKKVWDLITENIPQGSSSTAKQPPIPAPRRQRRTKHE